MRMIFASWEVELKNKGYPSVNFYILISPMEHKETSEYTDELVYRHNSSQSSENGVKWLI